MRLLRICGRVQSKVRLFDMNTRPYRGKTPGLLRTMFWRTRGNCTVPIFYGAIVLVVLVIWRVQALRCGKVP